MLWAPIVRPQRGKHRFFSCQSVSNGTTWWGGGGSGTHCAVLLESYPQDGQLRSERDREHCGNRYIWRHPKFRIPESAHHNNGTEEMKGKVKFTTSFSSANFSGEIILFSIEPTRK